MPVEWIVAAVKGGATAVGTALAWLLGGWDAALWALLILNGLDIAGGILQAFAEKKVNSRICLQGLLGKVYQLLAIGALATIERVALEGFPPILHTTVTVWFCVGQVISLLEHGAYFGLKLPDFVLKALVKAQKQLESGSTGTPGTGTAG